MMHIGKPDQAPSFSRLIGILFIFCIMSQGMLYSQTYFFDNYSHAEGLEQSKVFSIVQDKLQYIWLGTKAGISKFDGLSFTNYTNENGLAAGGVRVLYIDKNNIIWMGHEGGGISRWDGKKFEKIDILDSLIHSDITSIIQDTENQLWITTLKDGALVIKNPNASAKDLTYENFLKGKNLGDQIFSSMVASDSSLFFITSAGIRKYNKGKNKFETYSPEGLFSFFQISKMFEDSKGNYWFGTYNGGLYKLNRKVNKFEYFDTRNGLATNFVNCIIEDRNGNIWVGNWSDEKSRGGITRISRDNQMKIYNIKNGLHDFQVYCIMEDAEGNILIGTREHGLDIFKGEQFEAFSTSDGLIDNQVWAITQDNSGQVWFGTGEGITVYNKKEGNKKFVQFNQSKNFISNQIRFFRQDRNNNIWIGTADQGVMLYNTTQKKFIGQPAINSYFPYQNISKEVKALEIGPEGHLWIGTLEGLVEYDIAKNEYITTHTQGTGLAGNDITALFADSQNNLWVGSRDKGLTSIHDGKFNIVVAAQNTTPTSITEDLDGKIWIGTESKGVLVLVKDSIKQYNTSDGLLANLIKSIICDKKNNIYIGTNRGLNILNQQNGKILAFNQKTGFTGTETNSNASYMDKNGSLWFGTVNGAVHCYPGLIWRSAAEPIVHLTDMLVKGTRVEMSKGLKLASNENDITFHYISISLANPNAIQYQVLLEGLHDTWQDVKDENTILFNKLPPGHYIFNVRARSDFGTWSINPAQYSFRVLAPFYRRGYFIITVILILLAAIIAYIKIRERNLVTEKRVLEARVSERTLALSKVNVELSMKNKDIMDSIAYAKRIQFAILPPDIPFDNTFILFKPKDIVSGDFYWLNSAGGKEFLAAVDCTGHGVPGAFMSFIGFTSLNKIIIEQGIYQPAAILNHLNEEVAVTLHQKGEDIVKDGMDIALACFTRETKELEYAGAFNPLIIARMGEIIEAKADRFAIGHSPTKQNDFTNHKISLMHGDTVYLFSDGYADQFGGPDCKKFKTANLKELLLSIHQNPMDQQREILDQRFNDWKADNEQIDDVLIIGRKFNLD
jgi:ligand-binding sensor domain-containing protein/serine phosphatase RsbU (regulator of sigma subunit)